MILATWLPGGSQEGNSGNSIPTSNSKSMPPDDWFESLDQFSLEDISKRLRNQEFMVDASMVNLIN